VHWQFDKKGSSILIAFGMDLGGKLKWFHGSDNELGLFRKALMPFVLFSDMLSFYKPLKSLA
jgi:hypothetical protein